ncbi:MAG TPA: serine/threonine protein phosphatase [Pyrodictium sp.]|nr:serine/threonine protein phosphatase [Pyrodictium sp.]
MTTISNKAFWLRVEDVFEQGVKAAKQPQKFKTLLHDFISAEPWKTCCGLLEFDREGKRTIIVGDVHGDLNSLRGIVRSIIEHNDEYVLIFLGDYIDRGPSQVEVLAGLLSLALHSNENVILLRGNHEPPIGLEPFPHDYPYVLREYFGSLAEKLYELSLEAFNKLVLLAIAKGEAILVHGGPPTHLEEVEISELFTCTDKLPKMDVVEEILWNDPLENDRKWAPSPRGAGRLWGPKITQIALEKTKTKIIIRAHEPSFKGYKFNHGGKVLTLFSCKLPIYGNLLAAYLDVPEDSKLWKASHFIKTF